MKWKENFIYNSFKMLIDKLYKTGKRLKFCKLEDISKIKKIKLFHDS